MENKMKPEDRSFGIWRDAPVVIKEKCVHVRRKDAFKHKRKPKVRNAFGLFYGDVPVASITAGCVKAMDCVNTRGLAYRKNKKKLLVD